MIRKLKRDRGGFTLIEVVVIIAVITILAAILTPLVIRYIGDAKVSRAQAETKSIAATVMKLYSDTGKWPFTNKNGPSGGVDRVLSDPDHVPTGEGPDAGSGAENWGTYGKAKPLYDYLFYNNPDDDSGSSNQNQTGQDYPTTGPFAWKGPYIEKPVITDPWGNSYVINARYFPGNPRYTGTVIHTVFVLSAGPNGTWETPFSDSVGVPGEKIRGDDIGWVITMSK
ncbi:MAG: hypothetical protein DRG39_02820 [Deltaproteobacteria bacterium]|nr:MAG: hypothetical protein DRG39_02820 [Deltaproteobacteria bacterium]